MPGVSPPPYARPGADPAPVGPPAGAELHAFDLLLLVPREGRTRRIGGDEIAIRSNFCCLCQQKVERVGSASPAQGYPQPVLFPQLEHV
jgi:hypothetical protein